MRRHSLAMRRPHTADAIPCERPLSNRVPSPLSIVQVGAADRGGGAAAVATGLHHGYTARGHHAWHVVGRKHSEDARVVMLPDDDRTWLRRSGYTGVQRRLRQLALRYPARGWGRLSRSLRLATHPAALTARLQGREDFDFPGTHRVLELNGRVPDVIHAHNLHGGFFDLRALESISARVPTVITLHDMWMLTGHCAHSLECVRWATGCGHCPGLHLDPPIRRDATAENWLAKQAIYQRSQLHIAAPSQWLADQVRGSMLAPHVRDLRVIPNGVDTTVFRPADRLAVRRALGLPVNTAIVLLTTGSRGSMWKDDRVLRTTIERVAGDAGTASTLFVAVGRESAVSGTPAGRTRSIPYQDDPRVMAQYYQAADIYLHAARADTFPLAVLESMACGTPVIASEVGGIPEQVDHTTGILVRRGDAAQMAAATITLLNDAAARERLGANARVRVQERFDLTQQVAAYLSWFHEITA